MKKGWCLRHRGAGSFVRKQYDSSVLSIIGRAHRNTFAPPKHSIMSKTISCYVLWQKHFRGLHSITCRIRAENQKYAGFPLEKTVVTPYLFYLLLSKHWTRNWLDQNAENTICHVHQTKYIIVSCKKIKSERKWKPTAIRHSSLSPPPPFRFYNPFMCCRQSAKRSSNSFADILAYI